MFTGPLSDKGGLLVKTSVVENYPGWEEGINGFDLVQQMEKQASKYGAKIRDTAVVSVDFSDPTLKRVADDTGVVFKAKAVIICTGSNPNKLGLDREDIFWGKGISSCAVCDGALFKRKRIIVVGGGDSAMEEAQFLTKFSNVLLLHRGDKFRASKVMQARVLANDKVTVQLNSVIRKLHGVDYLEKVEVENLQTGQRDVISVDGLFYGLGLKPNTSLFRDKILLDNDGYVVTVPDGHLQTCTSVKGVFVAGDAHDKIYRQAVVAAGDGCRAAMDVITWLENGYDRAT